MLGFFLSHKLLAFMGLGTGTVIVVAGIGAILIYTGSPSACKSDDISTSVSARQTLQSNWDMFKERARSGPADIRTNEIQLTSRGAQYLDEEGVDVEELQVYLCAEGFCARFRSRI